MSADFAISRSIAVDAPAVQVFGHVADFRQWPEWSPWEGADSQLERSYAGPPSGAGASYIWHGKGKAGSGSMLIQSATVPGGDGPGGTDAAGDGPGEIVIDLRFTKPVKATNGVRFEFRPTGARTCEVTWTMTGRKMLPMRLLGPLVSMDRMLGPDFEKGLAALKAAAEKG